MCYGADRLARCEAPAKNGKMRKKQAPQCFTGFKACFSTQLTEGLCWTIDHCCIDKGCRRHLIRCWVGARGELAGFQVDATIVSTPRTATRQAASALSPLWASIQRWLVRVPLPIPLLSGSARRPTTTNVLAACLRLAASA
jgi:hypothetical protein